VNAYTKVALSVIRLAAFGCIILSLCLCAGDLFLYMSRQIPPQPLLIALKVIPFFFGLVLLLKSRALAEHFTKDLD
jgi:hypothetical protein